MPGRSLACCICFSWRARRPDAPAEGDAAVGGGGAGEPLCEGAPRWGVCAWCEDIVGGIGVLLVAGFCGALDWVGLGALQGWCADERSFVEMDEALAAAVGALRRLPK